MVGLRLFLAYSLSEWVERILITEFKILREAYSEVKHRVALALQAFELTYENVGVDLGGVERDLPLTAH